MNVTRVSEHIWSVHTWLVFPITVWLVKEEDGVTLVDAGIPKMAKGINAAIRSLGIGPLKRIVLTHGHSDHVGAVKRLLQEWPGVPVYAHRLEIPFATGEAPYPGRRKAAQYLPGGLPRPLPEGAGGRLEPIGGLNPYWTPGHAPGHVVYHHVQDDVLLAGDLFNAKRGRLHFPLFTFDKAQALESSLIVRELKPAHMEVCHGGPVRRPADRLDDYLRAHARHAGAGAQA
ncbi:Zn-dependent hydrolase, glyoxylase [Thermobacillus composti KWC4]|uniref:Zn-dependent hydrolase, glyoxylase n=1 Tax=Thermobacillus composti (strain DSM 18247 / JCM 13945 / KWC4) TaxID=717605 RepID=L0EGU4_THECK|nr:MBL fold metallo-hydrolase [Thermobacillus composti]AGA58906.1 Zn-dependent hydrolase, glyoxylase [Thermobacillus composti KWC4]